MMVQRWSSDPNWFDKQRGMDIYYNFVMLSDEKMMNTYANLTYLGVDI